MYVLHLPIVDYFTNFSHRPQNEIESVKCRYFVCLRKLNLKIMKVASTTNFKLVEFKRLFANFIIRRNKKKKKFFDNKQALRRRILRLVFFGESMADVLVEIAAIPDTIGGKILSPETID